MTFVNLRTSLFRFLYVVSGLIIIGGVYFSYFLYTHSFVSCHRFEKQISQGHKASVMLVDSVCDGIANSTIAWLELRTSNGQTLKFFEYEAAYSNVQSYDDAVPKVVWADEQTFRVIVPKVAAIRRSDRNASEFRIQYEIGTVMYP